MAVYRQNGAWCERQETAKTTNTLFLADLPSSAKTQEVVLPMIPNAVEKPIRKIPSLDNKKIDDVATLLNEEVPEVSPLIGREATQRDVLFLYALLLKLMVEGKKQERIARYGERLFQLEQIQATIDNFKKTASMLFSAAVIGCVLNLLAPIIALAGFTRLGKIAIEGMGSAFSSFQNLKPESGCEKISKLVSAIGQGQGQVSEVQKVENEGNRYKTQQVSEMARTDSEESTRNMEEQNQNLRSLEQELAEQNRRDYETAINATSRN